MTHSLAFALARLMMGWIFIPSGISKLADVDTTTAYITGTAGLPFPQVVALGTGAFEVLFGLALIVGFQTRIAGLALSVFCLATAVLFHAGKGYVPGLSEQAVTLLSELHFYMVFKNLAMAGGLLAIALSPSEAWSVDARLRRRAAGTMPAE